MAHPAEMPADFRSPRTAVPTLEKAAPASASKQTASFAAVLRRAHSEA
jgi:hypothetical protein